jgi:glycolate dehydrogenase iron-sulfur subunit
VKLLVDEDELAACVACGLCLPFCPTYRVTGDESASPRGRIAAMRAVHAGAPPDDEFVAFMDRCVQCRACEVACPSSVPFGRLMEGTRATLTPGRSQRLALRALTHHRALLAGSTVLAVLQRAHLVPERLGLPRLPLRRPALRATGEDVWLFTGCVMDAWQREVHVAAARVIEATGTRVALPAAGAACCGALHTHAGLRADAQRLAERVMAAMPGDAPVVVDSAGCGAALKDYGHLLGTSEAAAFSARVLDINEWLAPRIDGLPLARLPYRVAVQDPCHLRNVQKTHASVRTVLAPVASLVELDDEGMCCGAGGAYSVLQPALAGAIRQRKVTAIGRAGAPVVASANPGCAMHLAAAGLDVRHPIELVAAALHGAN